jgi:quercetin dioxygenase-like cupin family protein
MAAPEASRLSVILMPMPPRRVLLKAGGAAVLGMAARLSGASAGRLPSGTLSSGQAKVTHEPFGDLAIYFSGPTNQVQSMTAGSLRLKPGMSPHPPHQHPEEEFMVITEGSGEITVDGKKTGVAPGSMMYCAAGALHGIVNTGSGPLLFYFYKWKA